MRFKSWMLLLYNIDEVKSNSSCSRINVSDELDLFSGEYISQFEHNGNAQYFRKDGKFNLFSFQEGDECKWEISNLESSFPFSTFEQTNCETILIDSNLEWETFNSETETQSNEILIKCICSSSDEFKSLKISLLVIVIISSIILLILMHVNIRKRRILQATNECKICKQREEALNSLTNSV